MICGGSSGIGHAIARNFCAAGASKVVILGRRADVLDQVVRQFAFAYPGTNVEGRVCDVFNLQAASELWDEFNSESIAFDVMVWNAVHMPEMKPILEQGAERLWQDFEGNVHAPLVWTEKFYKQPAHTGQKVIGFYS